MFRSKLQRKVSKIFPRDGLPCSPRYVLAAERRAESCSTISMASSSAFTSLIDRNRLDDLFVFGRSRPSTTQRGLKDRGCWLRVLATDASGRCRYEGASMVLFWMFGVDRGEDHCIRSDSSMVNIRSALPTPARDSKCHTANLSTAARSAFF